MKYLTGRASARTEFKILDSIRKQIEHDPLASILVIVPSQITHTTDKLLMDNLGVRGLMGVRTLSPQNLVDYICGKVYGRSLPVIDSAGRSMMFCMLLSELSEKTIHLSSNPTRSEIAVGLSEFLSELKEMDITVEQLKEFESDDPDLKTKLGEISCLFERFEEISGGLGITKQDLFNVAINHISECDLIVKSDVYVMGFDSYSEQFIRMLSAIEKTARSITVSMVTSKPGCGDDDMFAASNHYLLKLKDACGGEEEFESKSCKFLSREAVHTERYLFAYPDQKSTWNENTGIYACDDREQEILACCEKTAQLMNNGLKPNEIMVVASDIADYRNYIKKYFGAAKIPYFLSEQHTLIDNPVSTFILSALKLCSGRLNKFRILEHVDCGLVGDDYKRRRIDSLIRTRIGNVYRLTKPLENESDEKIREELIVPLLGFIADIKKSHSVREKLNIIESYLNKSGALKYISKKEEDLDKAEFVDAIDYYSQLPGKFENIFRQMRFIDGDVEPKLLYDMLRSAFQTTPVKIIPALANAVTFGDIGKTYVPAVRAVMLIGVNEGILPNFTETPGLLSFRQLYTLKNHFTGIDESSVVNNEKFSIYRTCCSASESLYMFYHLCEQGGSSEGKAQPSYLVRKFGDIFRMEPVRADLLIGTTLLSNAVQLIKFGIGRPENGMDEFMKCLSAVDYHIKKELEKCRELLEKDKLSRLAERIADRLYPGHGSFSFFRTFFECPYKFLMSYGIRPEIEGDPELQSNEMGSYMHAVLDQYTKSLKKEKLRITELSYDELCSRLKEISCMVRAEDEFMETETEKGIIFDILDRELLDTLDAIRKSYAYSKAVTEESELDFCDSFGGIEVKGKIDRVDRGNVGGQDYFSVVDYKTGLSKQKKEFNLYDCYKGFGAQLPLYLLAMQKMNPEAKPVGAGYVKINPSDMYAERGLYISDSDILSEYFGTDGNSIDAVGLRLTNAHKLNASQAKKLYTEKEINDIMKYTEKAVRKAADDIRAGLVAPEPVASSEGKYACKHCEYKAMCGNKKDKKEKTTSQKYDRAELLDRIAKEVADE